MEESNAYSGESEPRKLQMRGPVTSTRYGSSAFISKAAVENRALGLSTSVCIPGEKVLKPCIEFGSASSRIRNLGFEKRDQHVMGQAWNFTQLAVADKGGRTYLA